MWLAPASVSAEVLNQFPDITIIETGKTYLNSTPDQVLVIGRLANGGVYTIQIEGGKRNNSGLQIDITGMKGDLKISNLLSFQNPQDNLVEGSQGNGEPLQALPVPAHYSCLPASTLDASVLDLAHLYTAYAIDRAAGTRTAPNFADALRMHRLIEVIFKSFLNWKPPNINTKPKNSPVLMNDSKNSKPSIVLVHGAFADASSWQKIILALKEKGFPVTAVSKSPQIPGRRCRHHRPRPPIAKRERRARRPFLRGRGHYERGNSEREREGARLCFGVRSDSGEALGPLIESHPPSSLPSSVVPDSAGFLYIDRNKFRDVFASDVSETELTVMAATQKPIAAAIFGEPMTAAAWKTIPSWYIVSTQDHAINPDLERFMAKRIKAQTVELVASHVPFISKPAEVVRVIETAAASVKAGV